MSTYYDTYDGYNRYRCHMCGESPCCCGWNRNQYVERSRVAPAVSLERQIELQAKQLAALLDRQEKAEKFGPKEQYEVDDSILFKRTFQKGRRQYTYVAVLTPRGWFITGQNSGSMSFEDLVENHLIDADEVWVCKEWEQIS